MKDVTRQFLEKAERAITTAEHIMADGDPESAAGRAYYAMFYVAEALLHERDLRFRKHGGVHAAFGEHFAKAGLLDAKYHRWLLAAFEKRLTADYEVGELIESQEVAALIQQAREFLQEAQRYLASPR